nr:galacturonosyltransferase 8-like [Ipomoea batatas]
MATNGLKAVGFMSNPKVHPNSYVALAKRAGKGENRILSEESLMRFQEIRVGFMEEKSVDSAMEVKDAANGGKFEECGAKAGEFVGTRNGSKAAVGNHDNVGGGNGTGTNAESRRTLEYNLGSHGYRRKEREWKRTLACKLYEERNESAREEIAEEARVGNGGYDAAPDLPRANIPVELLRFLSYCRSFSLLYISDLKSSVNPDKYTDEGKPTPPEIEDPKFYHYAIFSDNVVAAPVVNSPVKNSKKPWKHVFHIVRDEMNLGAMQVMFKMKDYDGAHI